MKSSEALTTMLEKFDDSKRAVANLMARENITVQVVDGLDTAKFSPELRVLQVPNWTGLSTEQCDLLMSHEIGHALFTDRKLDIKSLSRGLFSYLNIIEDSRIERRMKAAFPGLAPTFYKGYREFHAGGPILKRDADSLYNPKTHTSVKIASMRLIDRINLHYKIGAFCTVPFTAAERNILARIERTSSTADCLAIAKELWNADKNPENKQEQNNPSNQPKPKQSRKQDTEESDSNDSNDQDATDGESQDGAENESDSKDADGDSTDGDDSADEKDGKGSNDEEGDEDESDADGKSKGDDAGDDENDGGNAADGDSNDESNDESESSKSDDNSDNSDADEGEATGSDDAKKGSHEVADPNADTDTEDGLKSIASSGNASTIKHLIYPVLPDSVMKDRVVPAREFADRGEKALKDAGCMSSDLDALEAKWNAKYLATAKHMALEFERKKNAKCLAAAKTAKSGKLDLTKLSQYRWTEDLFKRSMTVPNGKSHGVVMMIDGSGSMYTQFAAVIDQTLLFAQFAFAVNIPFEAYMFSDCVDTLDNGKTVGAFRCESTGLHALTLGASGRLIGLINTTTDRAGFKKQVRVLLAMRSQYAADVRAVAGAGDIPNSAMGGTPLFTGMMIAERMVARMKREQKLDKTTFIVITDGEDTNRVWYKTNAVDPYSYYGYNRSHAGFEALTTAFVIRDVVSKKNLSYVNTSYGQVGAMPNAVLTMLLDVMKLRHDTRTVYIYLQESRQYSYRRSDRAGMTEGFQYLVRAGQMTAAQAIDRKSVTSAMTADNQYVLPSAIGVADLSIILAAGTANLTEDAFAKLDTENMTQKKIAAEFTKTMVKAVANRKFVNSIVPHLA